jgi:hypothetical protein
MNREKASIVKNLDERGHIWRGFSIYFLLGTNQAARAGGK